MVAAIRPRGKSNTGTLEKLYLAWQQKDDLQAGGVVFQTHFAAGKTRNSGNQTETKACARLGAALIESDESFQHPLSVFRWNACSPVADRYSDSLTGAPDRDRYGATPSWRHLPWRLRPR